MITLDGIEIPQPQELNERTEQINRDQVGYAGDRARSKLDELFVVEMVWTRLNEDEYQQIFDLVQDVVRFRHDASILTDNGNLDIDAVPEYEEEEYQGGAGAFRGLKVTLTEFSNLEYLATEDGLFALSTEDGDILVTE